MTDLTFKDRLWIWASLGIWATWLIVIANSLLHEPRWKTWVYFNAFGEGIPELIMFTAGTLYGTVMFYKTTR